MRKRTVVLAIFAALASVSSAQEPAPPPAAETPSAATPPAAPPPTPSAENRPAADDSEFIPTQELSADEAVTFPVDI